MLVRKVGLEPTHREVPVSKTGASTIPPLPHTRTEVRTNQKGKVEVYFAFYLFRQVINHKPHIFGDITQLEIPEPKSVVV